MNFRFNKNLNGEEDDGGLSDIKEINDIKTGEKRDNLDNVVKTITTNVQRSESPSSSVKKSNKMYNYLSYNYSQQNIDALKMEVLKLNKELEDKVTKIELLTHKSNNFIFNYNF